MVLDQDADCFGRGGPLQTLVKTVLSAGTKGAITWYPCTVGDVRSLNQDRLHHRTRGDHLLRH